MPPEFAGGGRFNRSTTATRRGKNASKRWANRARDRLVAVFREIAAAGRVAEAMQQAEAIDLERLEEHHAKAQQRVDDYTLALIELRRAYVQYQSEEWIVGIHVAGLVQRIDQLPVRIEGFVSRYNDELSTVTRECVAAGKRAEARVGNIELTLVITDWVLIGVEVLTAVGAIKVAATKIALKAMAGGLAKRQAYQLAAAYIAKRVIVEATIAAAGRAILPPALHALGLNESEIRAAWPFFRCCNSCDPCARHRAAR